MPEASRQPTFSSTKISRFLPDDFRPDEGIAILAGKGRYPCLLIEEMERQGCRFHVFCFEEATTALLREGPLGSKCTSLNVGQLGKFLRELKKANCRSAMMAGQITPGKLFKGLKPDWKALKVLASLPTKNADSIFSAVCREIEKTGCRLLDARCFMDRHLATPGWNGPGKRNKQPDPTILSWATSQARAISKLDIGQGIVISPGGTVLAVEGFDGTDALLRRCRDFRQTKKVFVKTVKEGQSTAFDFPVIGFTTLESLKSGGITEVWVEAEKTLLLDREELLERARDWEISFWGW